MKVLILREGAAAFRVAACKNRFLFVCVRSRVLGCSVCVERYTVE